MKKFITIITILISALALVALFYNQLNKPSNIEIFESNNIDTLIWYQIGKKPKDSKIVLEDINKYIYSKIGLHLEIKYIDWAEYNERMSTIMNSGEIYDMTFTSSWANDYFKNVQKGNFIILDELIHKYSKEMFEEIDNSFWEGVKINNKIYGVPTQKEISYVPMWVFTKEYIDKYNIPYQTIHSLQDLEPWLELIKIQEPEIIPLYINVDYSIPSNFEQIVDGVGISYTNETLKVKNFFGENETLKQLETMHYYYTKGYINQDAALTTNNKNVKRFVFKADGQPYAENIWSKDLGYSVVASNISEPIITNNSLRGAITAISKTSKYPKEAIQFLNLLNTDEYLRNLLNYGIESIHYEKVAEKTIHILKKSEDYQVPYYVQGNLFNTYLLQGEPETKWEEFKKFNQNSKASPLLGFNFNTKNILDNITNISDIINIFGSALHSGTLNPHEFVPKLNERLYDAGIEKVIREIQMQLTE